MGTTIAGLLIAVVVVGVLGGLADRESQGSSEALSDGHAERRVDVTGIEGAFMRPPNGRAA